MKKWVMVGMVSFIGMFSLAAFAANEHDHGSMHGQHKQKSNTLVGEVVDVTCYLSHPNTGIGSGHANCARSCINKGLPVAIKSGGKLYIASSADHKPVNKKLAKYAAQQVEVTGEIKEQDGLLMIFVKEVKLAE